MACKIANHEIIRRLEREIGAVSKCHSRRDDCLHDKLRQEEGYSLGINGGVVGYCQGLINPQSGSPSQHTELITNNVGDLGGLMPNSHELFIELKPEEMSVQDYINDAMKPLNSNGRVPIMITRYRPSKDRDKIDELLTSEPSMGEGDTMLLRLSLNNREDFNGAADIINNIYTKAIDEGRIPKWLPLLQNAPGINMDEWENYRLNHPNEWNYSAIAIHPFSTELASRYAENVIVAQWLVGIPDEIRSNGDVLLHTDSCTKGHGGLVYNVFDYADKIKESQIRPPTNIICGSSHESWNLDDNRQRLSEYLPLFNDAMRDFWGDEIYERVSELRS